MIEPKKFQKRPVVIEAVRWDGRSIERMVDWFSTGAPLQSRTDVHPGLGYTPPLGELVIPTLEGDLTAQPGDWVIKGVKGEFYPCKPDIFEATYDPAGDAPLPPPALPELDLGDWVHLRTLLLEAVRKLQADGQPRSRERALVITKLQEAGMWAGEAMMRE